MSLLVQLAIAAAIAASGFGAGWKFHAGLIAQRDLAAQMNERAAQRLRRQNTETAAVGFEKDRVVIREKFVPITQEVERVITKIEYRDRMCLDDDGLRAANRALSGGSAGAAGSNGPTLPASAPTR